jgi:hypothetical protein
LSIVPCMASDRTVTLKRRIRKYLEGSLLIYCRLQTFVGWQGGGRPRETAEWLAFVKRGEPETSRIRWRFADPQLLLVNRNGTLIFICFVKITSPPQVSLHWLTYKLAITLNAVMLLFVSEFWTSFSRECCTPASLLLVSLTREIVTAAITGFTCLSLAEVRNSSTKTVLKGPFPVLYLRILCDPKSCQCICGN